MAEKKPKWISRIFDSLFNFINKFGIFDNQLDSIKGRMGREGYEDWKEKKK